MNDTRLLLPGRCVYHSLYAYSHDNALGECYSLYAYESNIRIRVILIKVSYGPAMHYMQSVSFGDVRLFNYIITFLNEPRSKALHVITLRWRNNVIL